MKKLQVLSFIFSFILFIPFITFAYTISSEDYKYYTEKLINVTGNKNITNYYKIDNSSFFKNIVVMPEAMAERDVYIIHILLIL